MAQEQEVTKYHRKRTRDLFISLTLDVLGMATYMIPFLAELGDVFFAPFYGIAIFLLYRTKVFSASIGGIVGLIEELLPGADIIPTATIMWFYTYILNKKKIR